MKTILLSLVGILLSISVFSQSPNAFTYQAIARNTAGDLLTEQSVNFQVSILQGTASGSSVYTETHAPTSNAHGLVTLQIGKGTSSDNFTSIDWTDGPYFLKIEMDADGGTNYQLLGTSQLLSVPYAQHANTAERVMDLEYNALTDKPDITDTVIAVLDTTTQFLRSEVDGSITNEIQTLDEVLTEGNDAGGQTIVNLSQAGIGTATPNASSLLDITSTIKGILIPRMDSLAIGSIQDPEPGLIVMDTTDGNYNLVVFDGYNWIQTISNTAYYKNLVLWNKLGSLDEIENSEIGENGTIVGADYTFEPAYRGNGYVRTAINDNYVNFPGSILQNLKEKGTVELWINPKVTNPVAFSHGVYALVGNIFGTSSHVYIAWGDGTSGTGIYGSINFDGTGLQTAFELIQYVAEIGTPFHVAICWDVNGIDGSINTIRLYRNGELISTLDDTWDSNNTTTNYEGFNLGLGPDSDGYDKFIVDELKVWNFAKTSFDINTATYMDDLVLEGNIDANGHRVVNLADPISTQDAATKNYVDEVKAQIYDEYMSVGLYGAVKDVDGNYYKTVKIGDQIWMAENLRVKHYTDGTPIDKVTGDAAWAALSTPAYCWHPLLTDTIKYGALYNWYTVDTLNICPEGWHVPTADEWVTLGTALGGSTNAGTELKEEGDTHWNTGNTGTNSTGFTALPSLRRTGNSGAFLNSIGTVAYFWSSSQYDANFGKHTRLNFDRTELFHNSDYYKRAGFSIRCVRD